MWQVLHALYLIHAFQVHLSDVDDVRFDAQLRLSLLNHPKHSVTLAQHWSYVFSLLPLLCCSWMQRDNTYETLFVTHIVIFFVCFKSRSLSDALVSEMRPSVLQGWKACPIVSRKSYIKDKTVKSYTKF